MTSQAARRRILFLGCGAATRTHSRILRSIPNLERYYASRDAQRAQACCSEFDGAGSFDSYERALRHAVDLVVVATPPSSHLDLALSAVRAGAHVVVEKPAFMRSAEADVIRQAARDAGTRVFVAENYPHKPIAGHLRRLIGNGDLGEVRFVSVNATKRQLGTGWRSDPTLGGGHPLFEGGIHWISFMASIGLDVQTVHGFPTATRDSSLVVFQYANGAVGSLAHSWELSAPLGGLRLSKVQGTHGAVTFESNGLALVSTGRRLSVRFPGLLDLTGTRAMWKDILWALTTGAQPLYTLDDAQRDLRFVEDAGSLLNGLELDVEDDRGVRRDRAVG